MHPSSSTVLSYRIDVDLAADQLDDPSWTNAVPVLISRLWNGNRAHSGSHAEARLLWSPWALNVRFVCNQDQSLIENTQPRIDRKTLGLWERDVCEIFVAPIKKDSSRYFEFEAAPTGEWVDLAVKFNGPTRENDFDFQSGMTAAARVSPGRVIIAMRIPWSNLIPMPEAGDEWRANLFRCVGLGNERYLAWQPSFTAEPNFHVPEVFGKLRFEGR